MFSLRLEANRVVIQSASPAIRPPAFPGAGLLSEFALHREKELRQLRRPRVVVATTLEMECPLDGITDSLAEHVISASAAQGGEGSRKRP